MKECGVSTQESLGGAPCQSRPVLVNGSKWQYMSAPCVAQSCPQLAVHVSASTGMDIGSAACVCPAQAAVPSIAASWSGCMT